MLCELEGPKPQRYSSKMERNSVISNIDREEMETQSAKHSLSCSNVKRGTKSCPKLRVHGLNKEKLVVVGAC